MASDRLDAVVQVLSDHGIPAYAGAHHAMAVDILASADRVALAQAGELADWHTKISAKYLKAASGQPSRYDPDVERELREDAETHRATATTLIAQVARVAELEAALRPFARIMLVHDMTKEGPDMIDGPDLEITADQVRLARAALAKTPT